MEQCIRLGAFACRNLLRNRRRTAASALSISMSIFVISTLVTLRQKLEHPVPTPNSAKRAVIRNATSLGVAMPISYRDRIGEVAGVDSVAAALWFGGSYNTPANFFAQYAVDADRLFDIYPETHTEAVEQKEAFIRNRTASLAGRLLRERFGWKVGDRITLKGVGIPVDVETTIAGFVDGGGNEGNFYFHWDYLNELFPENTTQTFFIIAKDPADLPSISERIDSMFANSPAPTKTEAESTFIVELLSMWGNIRLFMLTISSVVLVTMTLVASNTMAMSIRERAAETAILRTLGFTPRHVVGMTIAESCLLCLGGGLIGGAGARCVYSAIDVNRLSSGVLQNFAVSWSTVSACAFLSLLVGVSSTFIPAFAAARRPIAAVVRRSGD